MNNRTINNDALLIFEAALRGDIAPSRPNVSLDGIYRYEIPDIPKGTDAKNAIEIMKNIFQHGTNFSKCNKDNNQIPLVASIKL